MINIRVSTSTWPGHGKRAGNCLGTPSVTYTYWFLYMCVKCDVMEKRTGHARDNPVLNILSSQKFPEQAIEYVTYMENDLLWMMAVMHI